jgi:hypothetical protein
VLFPCTVASLRLTSTVSRRSECIIRACLWVCVVPLRLLPWKTRTGESSGENALVVAMTKCLISVDR